MGFKLLGLALLALAASPAPALGAPAWLDETAPFGDVPALQLDADAAMAPDGTVVYARFEPGGALEVRERPPGGPVGPSVTIERVTVDPQPSPNLQVLAGRSGSAAVLFDAGAVRYAALRQADGRWGRPEPFLLARATRGQAALAPDGVLWGVGPRVESPGELSVVRLPHAAQIPLPPVPDDEIRDETPSIAVPRAGTAHVIYAERLNTTINDRCAVLSAVRAADVTAAGGSGPKQTLGVFALEGTPGANGCTFESGEVLFPAPQLSVDVAGGETAVFGVFRFDGSKQTLLARHREPGGEWPDPFTPAEQVGEDTELRDLAGPAAVLGGEEDEGASIAVRDAGGHWTTSPLTGGTPISSLRAATTGAGTTVFAWTEYGTGGIARARVLGADRVLGAPFTLKDGDATNVLGVGGDAEGNAVALYTLQRPDSSFRLAARGFDAAGPQLTGVSVPERGTVGARLAFEAFARDVWSASEPLWDFGDGTFAGGTRVEHEFGSAGVFTVRLRAVDAVGNTTTAARGLTIDPAAPPPPDTRPPVLTRVRVTPAHPHRGDALTLRLTTDEAGRARIAMAKVCRGCPRRSVSRVVRSGVARVSLGRLRVGTWRVTVVVTDAAGNASRPTLVTVRVTR